MNEPTPPAPAARAPRNPYLVLAAAILLPGSGHVLNGAPQRGLGFLFFIIVIGWASVNFMPPQFSFVGRHIGGVLVYGLSVIDAYQTSMSRMPAYRLIHPR